MIGWGIHMLVDGVTADVEAIRSKDNIAAFVKQLVQDIDMVAYGPLWIERFALHDEEKSGISCVQMIETSNITGHFVDKDGSFYIDIFSCKDFSPSVVIALIEQYFGANNKNLKVKIISRDAPKI